MPDKKDTIDWNSIPVVDDAKTASKDNNVDWNTVPVVEDETTPQKKSPSETTSQDNSQSSPTTSQSDKTPPEIEATLTKFDPITHLPIQAPPVDDTDQSPKDKTIGAVNTLANHVMSEQIPVYNENLKNTPFTEPGNIVHDVTDLHGDPSQNMTGKYAQYKATQLQLQKSQELSAIDRDDPDAFTERQAIKDKYDNQINELQSAAKHVINLQLSNRDYTQKTISPQDAKTQLWDISQAHDKAISEAKTPEDITNATLLYNSAKANIEGNTKFDAVKLGLEQQAMLGNKQATDDAKRLQNGLPLDEGRRVLYQAAGLDALQTAAKNAEDNGHTDAAQEMHQNSDNPQQRLVEDNTPYFRKLWANQIGAYKYNNVDNPWYQGTVVSAPQMTKGDVEKYGEAAGLTPDQIALVKPEEVPTAAGPLNMFLQSAFNSLTFTDPKDDNGHILTGRIPQDQAAGRGAAGIVGEVAGGAGTVAGFLGQTAIAGPALEATGILGDAALNAGRYAKAANLVPLAASNLSNAYENSKEVIGDKPEDEGKRLAYTLTNGVLSTALMSIDPATELAGGAIFKTPAGEQFVNALKKDGLQKLGEDEFKSKLQQAIESLPQVASTTGKHAAIQGGIMGSAKIAENITDMLYDPEHRHDVMDNVGQSAIHGAISMIVPSLLHGMHAADNPIVSSLNYEIGTNPDEYRKQLSGQAAQGNITAEQAKDGYKFITQAQQAVADVPKANILTNTLLTPEQRQQYAWNNIRTNDLNNKLEALQGQSNPDKSQVGIITSRLNDLAKERTDILNNAGKETPKVKITPTGTPKPEETPETTQDIAKEMQADYFKRFSVNGKLDEDDKKEYDNIGEDPQEYINYWLDYHGPDDGSLTDYGKKQLAKYQSLKDRFAAAKQAEATRNQERSVATDGDQANNADNQNISKENLDKSAEHVPLLSQSEQTVKTTENEKSNEVNAEGETNNERSNRPTDKIGGQSEANGSGEENSGVRQEGRQSGELNQPAEKNNEGGAAEEQQPPISVSGRRRKKLIAVEEDPSLQTIDGGTTKGKPEAKTEDALKEGMLNHPDKPVDDLFSQKPTGEKPEDFTKRIGDAMDSYVKPESEGGLKDNALVVTHSNVIKQLLAAYNPETKSFDFNHPDHAERVDKQSTEVGNLYEFKVKEPDGTEKTIHVARHGETEANTKDMQRDDNDLLTENGKSDAVDVANKLKEKGITPSQIVTSDLPRAKETADIIQKEFTYSNEKPKETPKPNGAIATPANKGLESLTPKEISNGDWQEEAKQIQTKWLDENFKFSAKKNAYVDTKGREIKDVTKIIGYPDIKSEMDLRKWKYSEGDKGHGDTYGQAVDNIIGQHLGALAGQRPESIPTSERYTLSEAIDKLKSIGMSESEARDKIAEEKFLNEYFYKNPRFFKAVKDTTLTDTGAIDVVKILSPHIDENGKLDSDKIDDPYGLVASLTKEQKQLFVDAIIDAKERAQKDAQGEKPKVIEAPQKQIAKAETDKENYKRRKKAALKGEPETFREAVLRFIVSGERINHADLKQELGLKSGDMKQYLRRISEDGTTIDHFVERYMNSSQDEVSHGLNLVHDAVDGRREFVDIWQDYAHDEKKALTELERVQGRTADDVDQKPYISEGEAQDMAWHTDAQMEHFIANDGPQAHEEIDAKIKDADLADDDNEKIISYLSDHITKEGKVNGETALDPSSDKFKELYSSLSDTGRGLLDSLLAEKESKGWVELNDKQKKDFLKIQDQAHERARQKDAADSNSGKAKGGSGESAPIGGAIEQDVAKDAQEKLNQAQNQERSVATDDQPEQEPLLPKENPRLKEIDLSLQKERASIQDQIAKGKTAEQKLKIALRGDDKDAIGNLTDEVNHRKDLVAKKEANIERLQEEQKDIQRKSEAEEREANIRKTWNDRADKLKKRYDDNKGNHGGEALSSILGISTKIGDHIADFVVNRTIEGIRELGNLHVAIDRGIRLAKEKFGIEANDLTRGDNQAIYDHLKELGQKSRLLKDEPVLSIDHEEYAKDILADIRSGKMSYEDAVKEVRDEVIEYRNGEPVSDHVQEKIKAKILEYIDWHNQQDEKDLTSPQRAIREVKNLEYGIANLPRPERQSWDENVDNAKKELAKNPFAAETLVTELNNEKNPSPISGDKTALLLLHRKMLENASDDIDNQINEIGTKRAQAQAAGDKVAVKNYDAQVKKLALSQLPLLDKMQQVSNVVERAGTELGRGLNAYKMIMNAKYELSGMLAKFRAKVNNGKELTNDQLKLVKDLQQNIQDTQKEVENLKKQIEDQQNSILKEKQRQAENKKQTDIDEKTAKKSTLADSADADKAIKEQQKAEKPNKEQQKPKDNTKYQKMIEDSAHEMRMSADDFLKRLKDKIKKLPC